MPTRPQVHTSVSLTSLINRRAELFDTAHPVWGQVFCARTMSDGILANESPLPPLAFESFECPSITSDCGNREPSAFSRLDRLPQQKLNPNVMYLRQASV